ncbi:hypothetical protein BDW74DRAFT_175983 [Aspergillus multicolor]|uniref:YdeI/OmpD-associated family protein n=1 Tax=Aspergillus multicolor TaxID=41759 RepID=UPI003CCE13C1
MPPKTTIPKAKSKAKSKPSTTKSSEEPPNSPHKPLPTDLPIHAFPDISSFTTFLSDHHKTLPGLHLKLAKKSSGIPSITAAQAVEVALCYGWIDGRANALDDKYWLVRYTPRRSRSMWSAKNVATVGRLIEAGRMSEAGMEVVDAAKKDGRWERAYDGPAGIVVPEDLKEELGKDRNEDAKMAFEGLGRGEWYRVLHRLQTGSVARRKENIEGIIKMLAGGEVNVTEARKAKVKTSPGNSKSFKVEKKTVVREGRKKDGQRGETRVTKRVERVEEASLSGGSSRQLRSRNRVK